jgi:hypothetical protein
VRRNAVVFLLLEVAQLALSVHSVCGLERSHVFAMLLESDLDIPFAISNIADCMDTARPHQPHSARFTQRARAAALVLAEADKKREKRERDRGTGTQRAEERTVTRVRRHATTSSLHLYTTRPSV